MASIIEKTCKVAKPVIVHGKAALHHQDCFEWLENCREESIHAVVTDPPYGLVEYREKEQRKLLKGKGGVWRIPPSFDGCQRAPLPRFTTLSTSDLENMHEFFERFGRSASRALVPGAHIFMASNPLVSHIVASALAAAGLENRGVITRLVMTMRGGDRPKNAHEEFPDVSVMPRSSWEPWGLFRKPIEGRVQDNLRKWGTGGLRRTSDQTPFRDIIECVPARGLERSIAPHPSLKPQLLMRQLVRASLPLGQGVVLDPFMGSGATIAAATALGIPAVRLEIDEEFFRLAEEAIPKLAALHPQQPLEANATARLR